MGAWKDFVASQGNGQHSSSSSSSPSLNSTPTPLAALKARPIRTLLVALAAVFSLTFILAAFGGPGHTHLQTALSTASSSAGGFSTDSTAATGRLSGWLTGKWGKSGSEGRFDTTQHYAGIEPEWTKDEKTGLVYPPNVNPLDMNGYKRAKATFVTLVRNGEKTAIMSSMRGVEDRFNRKFGYPWVFLNDEPFTQDFKDSVSSMTRSKVYFGLIPKEHWGYPSWIDQDKAREERQKMQDENVIYGGSESYRHMCRFNSGFFYRHELMQQFDYYWRVEPGVEFYCDIDYDPFLFMQENKKVYSFTIAIYEYKRTIETLWDTVKEFAKLHPDFIAPDNSLNFVVDDVKNGIDGEYNLCHFWSNFEIADLRFWRSPAYEAFFDHLDKKGGFFYERWGDAPVHSIAAALLLPSSALHQFDDIAYRHNPYTHCPASKSKYHDNGKCFCDPSQSFDNDGYSCMRQAHRVLRDPDSPF